MEALIEAIVFCDDERIKVTEVLTQVRHWNKYTPEWLEKVVNENLGSFLEERFGKVAAKIGGRFAIDAQDFNYGDKSLSIPGAHYSVAYKADDKKSGTLIHEVRFSAGFIEEPRQIPVLLDCLLMSPTQMTIELARNIQPLGSVAALRARGWELTSQLPEKVTATHAQGSSIEISVSSVLFAGFSLRDLWGDSLDGSNSSIVGGFIASMSDARSLE